MRKVGINCKAAVNIELQELTAMQGELKALSESNFHKLKHSILRHGITFPFFVWQKEGTNYILDGSQRDRVLTRMRKEGYKVPPLPCVLIEARDRREAAEKILLISSGYGKMSDESLYKFLNENALDFSELEDVLELPEIDLADFKNGYVVDPDYAPTSEDDQGRLDRKNPITTCPECGHTFVPK